VAERALAAAKAKAESDAKAERTKANQAKKPFTLDPDKKFSK